MKKLIIIIIALCLYTLCYSQKVDTIIKTDIYTSYFSIEYKVPLYVEYKLYKGGGDCERKNDHFKNTTKIIMATAKDFVGSGYDQGHMANAEDFAYDCIKQEATFRFENVLAQTANLNRGVWKVDETSIRQQSQTDSLLIICGGKFGKKIIGNNVKVPDFCFKIVKSLSTNSTHVYWYTNKQKNNTVVEITLKQLFDNKHLGYTINL